MKLPAGKIPAEMLQRLLQSAGGWDRSVVVGPGIGEDAAVIDNGAPELLVVKTDPITFASEDISRYLLAVNTNDLATMGAEPRWLMVTALLPEGFSSEQVSELFGGLKRACADFSVTLAGGHTEVTIGLDRPILVGCLLGTVPRDRLIRTAGARVGDALVLAGGIAIEGSAILAREHGRALLAKGVAALSIARAADWLRDPGISVMRAARVLLGTGSVHAMHDPTEGGLATALHEIADAACVGVRVQRSAVVVLPETEQICAALGLDAMGLLASGALVAAVDRSKAAEAARRLDEAGIPAAVVGEIVPAGQGRVFIEGASERPLPRFDRDELARYLEMRAVPGD